MQCSKKSVLVIVWASAIAALLAGCATYRAIEVKTARATGSTAGLTEGEAVRLFQGLASQLHFPVEGPMRLSNSLSEYAAFPHVPNSPDWAALTLWIDKDEYRFEVSIYGRKEDFGRAQALAAVFTRALNDRGLAYKIDTVTAIPPTGP